MILLGIETSCDETAAAIVRDGTTVLSNCISSSKGLFEETGGVIPENAARRQVECIQPVIQAAVTQASCTFDTIDAIAVTKGPGLLGSLLVGTTSARTLAALYNKPLIGLHHTLGHVSSTWLEAESAPVFPILSLSVSGGHTDLWFRESHTHSTLIGSTRDDAAGEAFDKGASLLGLPYPGGPAISSTAVNGDFSSYHFPSPLPEKHSLDFSFSGLKTSLKYLLRDLDVSSPQQLSPQQLSDIAASYENAICMHLCSRLKHAIHLYPKVREIHVVGGVSANIRLRKLVRSVAPNVVCRFPTSILYCTDNGAMIAAAGFFLFQELREDAYSEFVTEASVRMRSALAEVH
jgi:N6-L-threonylcarbamoyladenine synthase